MYIIIYHNHYCLADKLETCHEVWQVKDMLHNLIANGIYPENIKVYSAVETYEFDTFKEECKHEKDK